MDHGRNGIVCVTSIGLSLSVEEFKATVVHWYNSFPENRQYARSLAGKIKAAITSAGLQQLQSPEPFSLKAYRQTIKSAMHGELSAPFQAMLKTLERAVKRAIEETREGHENKLVMDEFIKLQGVSDFKQLGRAKAPRYLNDSYGPGFFLATAAACSQFAEACKARHPLSKNFVNPLWGDSAQATGKRLLSEKELKPLFDVFLPLLDDPVAIFQLMFWKTLRELANKIAHPDLPPKSHYDHLFNENWLLESGRNTFSAVFGIAKSHGELWQKMAEVDKKGKGKHSKPKAE